MTAGDYLGENGSVSNGASVTIRPEAEGPVWGITELGCSGAWELYSTNGTNETKIDSWPSRKTLSNRQFRATYANYYYIKNVSGASAKYHYKGIVLK